MTLTNRCCSGLHFLDICSVGLRQFDLLGLCSAQPPGAEQNTTTPVSPQAGVVRFLAYVT